MTLYKKISAPFNSRTLLTEASIAFLRVVLGLFLAFGHGLGKLPPSPGFVEGVQGLGFPAPEFFAWCASLAEFLGGLFIALGLLTRPAAAFVAFTMAVAFFGRHGGDPFGVKEMAGIYLTFSFFFLLHGAGRFSADYKISECGK